MGEVRARLVLENQRDRVLADAGHLDSARIRRVEIDALADTGRVMTLLPQDVVEQVGEGDDRRRYGAARSTASGCKAAPLDR